MKSLKTGIQLSADSLPIGRIKEIFSTISELLPFSYAMVSTQSKNLLDICVREVHDNGGLIFFWKQTFHKIGVECEDSQQLVGLNLEQVHKSWICPNNVKSTKPIIKDMRLILENHDVDGLFIDVFRYPSPYDGLSSMFSCFCNSCIAKAREMGIDLEKIRYGIKELVERIRLLSKEEITLLKKNLNRSKIFDQVFKDPSIQCFSKFRNHSINYFVSDVKQLVEESGRQLGLDVFPPSLAWLVGQDYYLLKDNCNWMKPMVYCSCQGPACMSTEIACLARDIQKMNSRFDDADLIYVTGCFLESHLSNKSLDEMEVDGLPEDLVRLETARAKQAVNENIPIYTGFEVVNTDSCLIKPEKVENYVAYAIEGGANGLVLSWDVALAPIENLKAVKKILDIINL